MEYTRLERIWLKNPPLLNERWVQERIAGDPTILGLVEVVSKDKEAYSAACNRRCPFVLRTAAEPDR